LADDSNIHPPSFGVSGMLNNHNWIESAEYVSLIGSVIGSVIAIFSGNAIYATVPLCFSLVFNTINRSRFEAGVRRNSLGINRLHRQFREELEALQLRSPAVRPSSDPPSLGQQLVDQALRQKASLQSGETSAPDNAQILKELAEIKEQYATLLESLNNVIHYLNRNGLVARVEHLETAIGERKIQSPNPMGTDAAAPSRDAPPPPESTPEKPKTTPKNSLTKNFPSLPKFFSAESTPIPQSWKCIQSLSAHSDWVKSIAISPSSNQFVTGSFDSTLKLWNLETGELEQSLDYHDRGIFGVVISPDGKTLASTSWDKTIKLWELPSGDLVDTLTGHSGSVRSAIFSHDSRTLISCSFDETIKIWDVNRGVLINTLTDYSSAVYCLALHPNGKILATGSGNGKITLWNLETNSEIAILTCCLDVVESLMIAPNGQTMIAGNGDGSIQIWQLDESELLRDRPSKSMVSLQQTLPVHLGEVTALAIAADGETFASASADGTVKIWHLSSLELLCSLSADAGAVMSLAMSPDCQCLVAGMANGSVKIWQRQSS
jgi:WD40 repeat protein